MTYEPWLTLTKTLSKPKLIFPMTHVLLYILFTLQIYYSRASMLYKENAVKWLLVISLYH